MLGLGMLGGGVDGVLGDGIEGGWGIDGDGDGMLGDGGEGMLGDGGVGMLGELGELQAAISSKMQHPEVQRMKLFIGHSVYHFNRTILYPT